MEFQTLWEKGSVYLKDDAASLELLAQALITIAIRNEATAKAEAGESND